MVCTTYNTNEVVAKLVLEYVAECRDADAVNSLVRGVPKLGRKSIEIAPRNTWYKTQVMSNFVTVRRDEYGEFWELNGKLHRGDDLPAIIYSNGHRIWYKNGYYHREGDLPAVAYNNGTQEWYKKGYCHRDGDLPAVVYSDGRQEWYKDGKRHRDRDLPAVVYANGNQNWYKNGKLHREGGNPAVVFADGARY